MSKEFEHGGSHLERESSYDKYTDASGRVGYGPSANDPNGSCYWADKENMDPIWQHHDSNIAEHELGFKPGTMNGESFVRVDCDDLSAHNQRVANGREAGANENFTGVVKDSSGSPVKGADGQNIIDPSIYNQRTSGGQPECVTDQMPKSDCHCSAPQRFDDPNELSDSLCKKGDAIAAMPEGDAKDAKLSQWNTEASALQERMAGEQDYLQSRIADHEKRMSEYPEGSLEHERAKENRDWCQNYSNELSVSQNKLQEKQAELNKTEQKTETTGESATQKKTEEEIPATAAKGNVEENASSGISNTAVAPQEQQAGGGAGPKIPAEAAEADKGKTGPSGGMPQENPGGVASVPKNEAEGVGTVNPKIEEPKADQGMATTAPGYTPPAPQEAPQSVGIDKGPSM